MQRPTLLEGICVALVASLAIGPLIAVLHLGLGTVMAGFLKSAEDSHQQAHAIRDLLFARSVAVPPPVTGKPPARRNSAGTRATKSNGPNGKGRIRARSGSRKRR